ncbi:MAG: hypothetical protein PHH17_00430 [Candidatus Pacebacteria bacterium]|jgi:hypothetical protein|nr:hypothetical protein [Candidatus Paceibacterota bacterium]MDD3072165.1 hypothetical protein [Candidatus Paceibacterota bacterium]MDD3728770.1 hypothetical protein [Candidatus Paceibacterota bacterium]MDD4201371.1 hypothetical protein [Candidatus Paceibacterota bacterium]MDD4466928.1 hypothetical protein [Candidatus Paceibacterota bacterium]
MLKNKKFVIIGFLASLLLFAFYILILSFFESSSHAFSQFSLFRYWISILIIGFGIQVGLFSFVREKQKTASKKTLSASCGISAGSMVACCLHHLADILPLIGISGMTLFFTEYQLWFMLLGIISNFMGIAIMLGIIEKHNLAGGVLAKMASYSTIRTRRISLSLSLIVLFLGFFWVGPLSFNLDFTASGISSAKKSEKQFFPGKTDSQGDILFEVTPLSFESNKPLEFNIKIDTHFDFPEFDLMEVSILEYENGKWHKPLEWQGPSISGHHISGVLVFPPLEIDAKELSVIIKDEFMRVFRWEIY